MKYCPDCKRGIADLHVHTNASDGYYSPHGLVDFAQRKGLQYLAITDHDTTAGLEQIERLRKSSLLKIISGIELSTEYEGQEIHILGYCIDYNNIKLQETLNVLAKARKERVEHIVKKLQKAGFSISIEDIKTHSVDAASLGRPHVALALLEKGIVKSISEAFEKYLKKGRIGYVARYRILPQEAISLIIGAGGYPVLAHPGNDFPMELLTFLVKTGLQGLEVFYPQHNDEMQKYYFEIAKRKNLLITGGSDFHGHDSDENPYFGNIPIPASTISRLIGK
jgi:predicted metal-dependent phosphoesterase TrpH